MNKTSQKSLQFAVLATDLAIITLDNGILKVLTVRTKSTDFPDTWSLIGGLVKPSESLESSARRYFNTFLKVDSDAVHLEQLYTFGDPHRDPSGRVVSVAYLALVPQAHMELKTTPDYQEIAWHPLKNLPELAYDHKEIIKTALARIQGKISYTNIIYSLLPKEFTLTQLQSAYEVILNRSFDKRNFRKKLKTLKLIKKLPKHISLGAHRPAQLYAFIDTTLKEVALL